MGSADVLLLVLSLRQRLVLVVTFETLAALVRVAVAAKLNRERSRLWLDLMQELCGGMMGLGLMHLMRLVEELRGGVVGRCLLHLIEQLS